MERKMPLIPKGLIPGDTIGIAAPSSPFDFESFKEGKKVLESLGFNVSSPQGLFNKQGYLAGTDKHRGEIINHLFADSSIKAIFCARGGFGAMKILSFLDYKAIRKNPKIFVGFSDVTALLSALYTKCRLVTFHGPTICSISKSPEKTISAMMLALSSKDKMTLCPKKGVVLNGGVATGSIAGGNLTTLCHLLATPFQQRYEGKILLLEDRGEAEYRIDRMLTQMMLAGSFNNISGLILGSFEECGSYDKILEIFHNTFRNFNIPIIAGFEIGHGVNNLTIPIGVNATLNADLSLLTFNESATLPR